MSQDFLNPDNTPQEISSTREGKYLGRGPIIIIVLVLAAVTYAIMVAANKRAQQQNQTIDRDAASSDDAGGVAGDNMDSWLETQPDGAIFTSPDRLGLPASDEPEDSLIVSEADLLAPAAAPQSSGPELENPTAPEPTAEDILYQKYLDKRLKEHIEAADSGAVASSWDGMSGLGNVGSAFSSIADGRGAPVDASNPMASLQNLLSKRLDNLQDQGPADPNGQAAKRKFANSQGDNDWYLERTRNFGINDFEIKTGAVIPGILLTGMNSDLPGQVIGQVRQNVYDTATGRYLLIPQGTKIYGTYDSEITYGQRRGLVVWQRLVFPDATTIDIDGMQGNDVSGYAGFKDRVNNHYVKTFGSILLLSVFNALPELVRDDEGGQFASSVSNSNDGFEVVEIEREQIVRNEDGENEIIVLREEVIVPVRSSSSSSNERANSSSDRFNDRIQEQIALNNSRVGERITEKNLDIQPTITIRPGYRFNIIVNKDIVFEGSYVATR